MSDETEKPDLCHPDNEDLLQHSIYLYREMFQLPEEPDLYYYFSTLTVLRLLLNFGAIGIKVEPALVHVPEDSIDLTVILKPVMHPVIGDNSKSIKDIFGDDLLKKLLEIVGSEPEILGSGSAACCPTPGRPLDNRAIKEKLTYWIDKLTAYRDNIPD